MNCDESPLKVANSETIEDEFLFDPEFLEHSNLNTARTRSANDVVSKFPTRREREKERKNRQGNQQKSKNTDATGRVN